VSDKEKQNLLEKLDKHRLALLAELKEIDLQKIVYENSGWRVRDIVGHIATWNLETARSLNAFLSGSEYSIPDLDQTEVDYNERAVVAQKKFTDSQILKEWEHSLDELTNAIQEIPSDNFSGTLLYPWGDEYGSITLLVEYMIGHAIEHLDDIP
jgi:hypothetical protein